MRTGQTEEKEEQETLFELNKYILKSTDVCAAMKPKKIQSRARAHLSPLSTVSYILLRQRV